MPQKVLTVPTRFSLTQDVRLLPPKTDLEKTFCEHYICSPYVCLLQHDTDHSGGSTTSTQLDLFVIFNGHPTS